MKRYPLTRGKYALIDDDDFDQLVELRRHWRAVKRRHTYYAVATIDGRDVYMHRWILDAPSRKHVDHENGDGLDNQRENLRLATRSENNFNRQHSTRSKSGFWGVRVNGQLWMAYVGFNRKQIYLGSFRTPEAAAVVRDDYMRRNHPTGRLNFEENAPISLEEAMAQRTTMPAPKSGHKMIRFRKGAYEVDARVNGRRKYVGRFKTLDEALRAQETAKRADH